MMKLTVEEYQLFQIIVGEYYDLHPQLGEVSLDDNDQFYEYHNGEICYDSFGPKTKRTLYQLESKVKSLL